MFANPVVSSDDPQVLYDTFTTFTENLIPANYTVLDGVSYVSHQLLDVKSSNPLVECAGLDTLPSINSIVSVLSDAMAVSSISTSSGKLIECASGKSFKVTWNGVNFGLCFSGSSGFTMHGNDVDVVVEYEKEKVIINAPRTEEKCAKSVFSSAVTSIGKSLLTGEPFSAQDARKLEAAFGFEFTLAETICGCKSTPRPCVFLHGLAAFKEEKGNLNVDPYWGNLANHAPCCSSMQYVRLETMNTSWTDTKQQHKVCDHLLAVNKNNQNSTISGTIIVTHSMGGLLVAAALASRKCHVDSSTSWVAIASPMRGSMSSDYFQESCKDNTNFVMEALIDYAGLCPGGDGIRSLAYEEEKYSSKKLDALYVAAQKAYRSHVTAAMCSNGNTGLRSNRQAIYWVLGRTMNHKSSKNDGIVEFYSCAGGFPESKFGETYHDRFYVTKLNHADAAFRNGDALLNTEKMPLKWFECLL
ncbi:hypothetical protein PI125_g15182 [Phytophthora idaei]|nr:hypothetical protein PI125_g15182 [Phytophthora idaei]